MKNKFLLLVYSLLFFCAICGAQEKQKAEAPPKVLKGIEKTGVSKIQDDRIMLLNAYNFDFGSTSLSSNYVGHLNLFSPSLNRKNDDNSMEDKPFGVGFNTGILKINYSQKDSSNTFQNFKENVFVSPFDELKDGLKYLRQINNYKVETKNTVWSFYVQPTLELTKATAKNHIYAHLHAELLASRWSSTTKINVVKEDTSVFNNPAPTGFVIRSRLSEEVTTSSNVVAGYFGTGFTFDLSPWNGGSFFFQPTFGFTTNKPSASSTAISNYIRGSATGLKPGIVYTKRWNPFYLVRAYYTHSISKTPEKEGSTIVLGMDIRGFFPDFPPQYAAYIGLNVGLDSVLELIKGK